MDKKIHSGMMLTLLLAGTLTLVFNIQPGKSDWTWTETVYIRADGSVDPDTAPISTVDYITYTLTDNIVGDVPEDSSAIVVERDNIVVDGAGYTVHGTGAQDSIGIYLSARNNVTIKNTKVKQFWNGIFLSDSNGNTLSGNVVSTNTGGTYLQGSNNNTIIENNLSNNYYGISLAHSSCLNRLLGNTASSNEVSGIGLHSFSNNNILVGNTASNNTWGINLDSSTSNNTLSRNFVSSNSHMGIWLYYSNDNYILDNTVSLNGYRGYEEGIQLSRSHNNTIGENTVSNNYHGIGLHYSSVNVITGNDILSNKWYGIWLYRCADEKIYHNNFIENGDHVKNPYLSKCIWDDGYPSGGNHWSDYITKGGYDADGDGLGDIPYVIDENNQDNYPLMEPWTPTPPIPTTIEELKTEIEELGLQGEIDNQGIVRSLIAKLNVAQKLVDKGKIDEAKSILEEDFIPQVQNLTDIHVTPETAELLMESAEYIISHL